MFTNALSRRKAAVACVAVSMSSIRALGQTPEDESRLLAAAVAPKIKDVEESSLTVEFITGPNLYSYAFTVECFAREEVDGELVPLTSCSAAADSTVIPVSQSGETGKALSKVDVVVSPLLGDEIYDCFLYTEGPNGYEKCKYVGSSDITCTSADPVDVSGAESSADFDPPQVNVPVTSETIPGLGNPPLATDSNDFYVGCVLGAAGVCPFAADATDVATTWDDLVLLSEASPPSNQLIVSQSTDGLDLINNQMYTCFGLAADQCGEPDAVTCSDPVEVITSVAPQVGSVATVCETTIDIDTDPQYMAASWTVSTGGNALLLDLDYQIVVACGGAADPQGGSSYVGAWANAGDIPENAWQLVSEGNLICDATVDDPDNPTEILVECGNGTDSILAYYPADTAISGYVAGQCWLGIAYGCTETFELEFGPDNLFSGTGCSYGYAVPADIGECLE